MRGSILWHRFSRARKNSFLQLFKGTIKLSVFTVSQWKGTGQVLVRKRELESVLRSIVSQDRPVGYHLGLPSRSDNTVPPRILIRDIRRMILAQFTRTRIRKRNWSLVLGFSANWAWMGNGTFWLRWEAVPMLPRRMLFCFGLCKWFFFNILNICAGIS